MRKGGLVLLLGGASLAAVLTFAVVPAVTSLYAAHHRFGGAIDAWIIDVASLVANAALVVALVRLRRRDRGSELAEEDAT